MSRPTLPCAAILCSLLVSAVHGQEPAPARVQAPAFAQDGVELVYAWRYHPDDDPRWADPAFDDSGWELAVPLLPPAGLPRNGWPGTGWFRRHLRVEPAAQHQPLAVRVETSGTTAVFLDGQLLLAVTQATGARRATALEQGVDHVLAVRHTSGPAGPDGGLGFRLTIERPDSLAVQLALERRTIVQQAMFSALPAFLALFHLALFWSYPKARENLFYACSMAASAGIVFCDLQKTLATTPAGRALANRAIPFFVIATIFFVLLTYYAVRTRSMPRTWIAFAVVGAVLAALGSWRQGSLADGSWSLFVVLVVAEIVRVERSGRTVEREGVKILLRGLLALNVMVALQVAINLGLVPPIAGFRIVYVFGLLAFAVSMSLFLARSVARTNLHLEHKSAEIEAARTLQLSMLPRELPRIEGLEIAAAMTTASEVGGDYYDFRARPDGSLVVAFGDAAGHGVAAGLMVAAIKAFFSALGGGESLAQMLAECDRLLRGMNIKLLHMCLTLARINGRAVTVCSAAMPPVLIHRAATGAVEELGAGGLPLGSKLAGAWQEQTAALAAGDTILFASDGFAELLDPADNVLGFGAAVESFRAAATEPGISTRDLIDRLLARVTAWRGGREQADDITFVVVRASARFVDGQASLGVL